jgi:hypothetical protein
VIFGLLATEIRPEFSVITEHMAPATGPEKLFWETISSVNFGSSAKLEGIEPLRLFSERSSDLRLTSLLISDGMVPFKFMFLHAMLVTLTSSPMQEGIVE